MTVFLPPFHGSIFDEDLALLCDAALQAGDLCMQYFGKPHDIEYKGGRSPVTQADIASDLLLKEFLLKARPDYGWLSEETEDILQQRNSRKTFIVDPIDGTRGFIAGQDDWTVSLALVQEQRPIVSVVFNPVRQELYAASFGHGAYLNGKRLQAKVSADIKHAKLAGARKLLVSEILQEHQFHPKISSLAYRLLMIADGRLDGLAIRPSAKDWDIAGADLIVHEAGAYLRTINNDLPLYNEADISHHCMVAGHASLIPSLMPIVRHNSHFYVTTN